MKPLPIIPMPTDMMKVLPRPRDIVPVTSRGYRAGMKNAPDLAISLRGTLPRTVNVGTLCGSQAICSWIRFDTVIHSGEKDVYGSGATFA
jgi:hypothetical protein